MMPPSLSDKIPSTATLLLPQETATDASTEAPLLPFAAVLSGTLALLPPTPKASGAGLTASEEVQLPQDKDAHYADDEEPSAQENGFTPSLQIPTWPGPFAPEATVTPVADAEARTNHATSQATTEPVAPTQPVPLQAGQRTPVPPGLPAVNASPAETPTSSAASLPSGQTLSDEPKASPSAAAPTAPHEQQTVLHGEETPLLRKDLPQNPAGGSSELQPEKLPTQTQHTKPSEAGQEGDPVQATRTQANEAGQEVLPSQATRVQAIYEETASLREGAAPKVAPPLDPELPEPHPAGHLRERLTASDADKAPPSETTQQAAPPRTKAAVAQGEVLPLSEPALSSKAVPLGDTLLTADVKAGSQAAPEAASPPSWTTTAEAARPAQGKGVQGESRETSPTPVLVQTQEATGKESLGQETGQHAGSNHSSNHNNEESPVPPAVHPPAKTPPKAADLHQPVAAGLSQEQLAEGAKHATAPTHRDGDLRMTETQHERPAVQPPHQASTPDVAPLPEVSTPSEAGMKLAGTEEGAMRTAAEAETTTPGGKAASSEGAFFGRDPMRPAWLRAVQSRSLHTYTESGWNVLEMQLDEGDGMITIKARREEERVAVSIGFSDPTLRALASAQTDRLQQVLQAQYETAVDFSLMNSDSDTSGRKDDSSQAPGSASPTDPGKTAAELLENSRPARGPMSGVHEWVG